MNDDVILRFLPFVLVNVGEAITSAWFRQNEARRRRVVLDLGAQLADEHAQVLRVVLVRWPPHRGENLPVR